MTGHACPECDAYGEPMDSPNCTCPAPIPPEDFDPLRIRPYVTLNPLNHTPATPPGAQGTARPATDNPHPTNHTPAAPFNTDHPIPPGARGTAHPAHDNRHPTNHANPPGARGTARPATDNPHPTTGNSNRTHTRNRTRTRTRNRPLWLTLAAAAIATTAFATNALLGGGDGDETGAATTVSTAPYTEATPTSTSSAPSSPHTPRTPTGTTTPRKPSPTPTRTAKHQPTPTQPHRPAAPPATTPSQITGTVGTTTTTTTAPPPPATAPVLRRGDSGPEVAELQDRLAQLTIYNGRIDGRFTSKTENAVRTYQSYMGLQSDPPGVYGPETRRALEAQTS